MQCNIKTVIKNGQLDLALAKKIGPDILKYQELMLLHISDGYWEILTFIADNFNVCTTDQKPYWQEMYHIGS
jgi:hypothetical protein